MKQISAPGLIDILKQKTDKLPDDRKGNALKYPLSDVMLAAFSVFFTQSPSFLAYQRDMQERDGSSNAQSLFNMVTIPSDNQIRNVLDQIKPSFLTGVFHRAFKRLDKTRLLDDFTTNLGSAKDSYLLALDGTGYFSSTKIHCKNCSKKVSKKTGNTTYSHNVMLPALVKPDKAEVIPLPPEFITRQDGDKKQDCENKAAKRWLKEQATWYVGQIRPKQAGVTILGDDLYSRQPVIEAISRAGCNYILVCKEKSHKWMYDHINTLETKALTKSGQSKQYLKKGDLLHTHTTKEWNGKYHILTTYRYAYQVPLKDPQKNNSALLVNWLEITQTREKDGKKIYKNAFITDHTINQENIFLIVKAGRARWKVENEDINTLKTKGYHFTHNYGHGEKHLSSLLVTLILIAYLFHTLLDLGWELYHQVRQEVKVRVAFFNHIKTLTIFMKWESWDQLFEFMQYGLKYGPVPPPG